jgi:hypothetical protein
MSSPFVPAPKLPHFPLPNVRGLPSIPHVGCAGGNGASYVGEQFGNLPDLHAALAMKKLKKALEEQIYALIQGQLPDATRPPVYAARAAQLVNEVAELVQTLNETIAIVTAEANASINFVNEKISDINAAKSAVLTIPAGARSAVQRLALQRYNEYLGELNSQVGRLQATIACIAS